MDGQRQRVFLDASALGRLFDSESQLRIRIEAAAVGLILSHTATGIILLGYSFPLWNEISANPNRRASRQILSVFREYGVFLDDAHGEVARTLDSFRQVNLIGADALHAAVAQVHGYDFVTCDDRLLSRLKRHQLSIWCGTPEAYCEREALK